MPLALDGTGYHMEFALSRRFGASPVASGSSMRRNIPNGALGRSEVGPSISRPSVDISARTQALLNQAAPHVGVDLPLDLALAVCRRRRPQSPDAT
jgi:hypothetical protein